MRVLHVIPSVAKSDGGPSTTLRAMAQGLSEQGHRVTVATTDAGLDERLRTDSPVPIVEHDVNYLYFRRTLPGKWKYSRGLHRWLFAHVSDYDVVHVHALFSHATIPACRAAETQGVPFVLRPLGTLEPWSLSYRAWKKKPYLLFIEQRHLRTAAAVHATSIEEGNAIESLGYARRICVIPLGVDQTSNEVGQTTTAQSPPRLLFLSRLHPKKGLPLLLEALARLRKQGVAEMELVVAGDGPSGYRRQLKRLCRSLDVEDHVRFVGHVEGDAKLRLMRSANLFVLPSYQENFGVAVAEAMAASVPVLVSDRVALSRDVLAAGAGMVTRCDSGEIARAIALLMSDRSGLVKMGQNGARLVQERFSWKRTCSALTVLYDEIRRRE